MSKFPFLRRPVRLILYAALLALVTTAALIFAWQYKLDGLILEQAIDTYAYVGTVVRADGQILDNDKDRDLVTREVDTPEMGGAAFLEEIPEELIRQLNQNESVARIDSRETLAALIGDCTRVQADTTAQTIKPPDQMMTITATPYYFLEGTVSAASIIPTGDEDLAWDTYHIQVDRMWSDPDYAGKRMLMQLLRTTEDAPLEVGQRVFLLGSYVYSGSSGQPVEGETIVHTPAYIRLTQSHGRELTAVEENRMILIPEGEDPTAFIEDLLTSTGLDSYLERQVRTRYSVTLRATKDMAMIPLFAKGKAKIYEGRMLTSADMGTKVCVISSGLSQRNRLSPGDTIQLAVADGCYTIRSGDYNDGWESGDPGSEDELLEYGDYETHTIVGVYSQIGRRTENALYFPYGDIFVPADTDTVAETARPYTFSFRVPGPDYVDFLAQFEPVLEEAGYSLVIEDTGWDDVKESFYTMQTRRQLMLLCAAAAFAAAVLVFAVLLNAHCRYEYGLRRLMGASKREAAGIYGGLFLFTGIPGGLLAVGGAWLTAVKLMKDALASDALLILPTDAQCAGTLMLWAALELAAVLVVLFILARRGEKRGLLGLIRR